MVQIVPRIGEFPAEAVRAIGAQRSIQSRTLDNLLVVVETVERGVFDREQDVGYGVIVESIRALEHPELPLSVDAGAFHGQEHVCRLLTLELEEARGIDGRADGDRL